VSALAQTALELRRAVAEARSGWSRGRWLVVVGLAFAAGLLLGVVEAAIANVHLGGWQLGPSYREVLPLAFVLLLISLWPSREALEERE
jgi:uncharacterized protein YaaW (UPF0174 family)